MATALSVVLVFGAVAPGFAVAGEGDSEQEGSAPPGAVPGLDETTELETSEETELEEVPGVPSSDGEGEESQTLETEPVHGTEEPAPPSPQAPSPAAEVPPVPEETPPAPKYSAADEPTAPSAPSVPVENEAVAAPESRRPSPQATPKAEPEQAAPDEPPSVSPPDPPEPAAVQPPGVPAERNGVAGSLAGKPVHIVEAGECLWSIAEALLSASANSAEIAAEVRRLWRLNVDRIATGDPNQIYAGTELRLN